jgi:hypothetical protein
MRKQDLEIGVEYAVFTKPSASRRSRWYRGKPMRAKLIAIEGEVTDTFEITEHTYDLDTKQSEIKSEPTVVGTKGIVVELLDTKFEREVPEVGRVSHRYGNDHYLTPAHRIQHPGRYGWPEFLKSKKRSYSTIALENAGCFYMTWADYEAEVAEEEAAHAESRKRMRESLDHNNERDPARRAMLSKLLQLLRDRGFEVDDSFSVNDDPMSPSLVYVTTADGEREFTIDVDYEDQGWRGSKLIRAEIERLDIAGLLVLMGEERSEW